jgi:hypothetical protein
VFAFGVFPALAFIAVLFLFFRADVIHKLSLKTLTLLHMIRVPVELTLLLLFYQQLVPRVMTFEGMNFDILSGLTAPIAYYLSFRNGETNSSVLIAWNIFALLMLVNIVSIAALSLPSPIQQMAFDQPNIAVMYFPFIWLPAIVVPIVLFAHLAALWKLLVGRSAPRG